MTSVKRTLFIAVSALTACLIAGPLAAQQIRTQGAITTYSIPAGPAADLDFANAKPVPLPQADASVRARAAADNLRAQQGAAAAFPGAPAMQDGGAGTGTRTAALLLGTPAASDGEDVINENFGTSLHPFTTARTDLYNQIGTTLLPINKSYPYRAAGKLFFNIGTSTYLCSASLIKPGVVVTAAHCVANYGASQFYSNWRFVPGYSNGVAPFGTATAYTAVVMTAYFNGTDGCAVYGIVCPDDVAVLVLNKNGANYIGTKTGWFGYGWNGWGFTPSLTHVSQLGYPVCLDNGVYMERNDSYGYVSGSNSNNTVIGSLMCGGSSGGPWVNNLGLPPVLTGTTAGTYPNPQIVVGVTSWGYTDPNVKEQGASPFTSNNIVPLVTAACSYTPSRC